MKRNLFLVLSALFLSFVASAQVVFQHIANSTNTNAHITTLNNTQLNGNTNFVVFAQPIYAENGDRAISEAFRVSYQNSRWTIAYQNTNQSIAGVRFQVLAVPANLANVMVHTATAANMLGNATLLNHPILNGNPNAVILVTQQSEGNNHEVGVQYQNNRWSIFNLNGTALPANARFSVLVATADNIPGLANTRAFTHTHSPASQLSNNPGYTVLDNPLINGNANGYVFLSQQYVSVANPNPMMVWYDSPNDNTNYKNGYWLAYGSNPALQVGTKINIVAIGGNPTHQANRDLTGFYRGDNGSCGQAYIRQIGNNVYWFGEHPDGSFGHVFSGTISGNTLTGNLWDVPKGTLMNKGNCIYNISSDGNTLTRAGGTLGCNVLAKTTMPTSLPASKPMQAGSGALTGVWDCNDGAVTYAREDGNDFIFFSEAKNNGTRPGFANLYIGKRNGNTITGDWIDVPKGTHLGSGKMTLLVENDTRIVRTDSGNGYGGGVWTRSTNINSADNWDFETGDLRGWTATGVFLNQPTLEENFTVQQLRNSLPILTNALRTINNVGGDYWQDAIYPIGIQGKYWVGSGENRRTSNIPVGRKQSGVGVLISKKIVISTQYISFLMGRSSFDTTNLKVELLIRDNNGTVTIENERYRVAINGVGKVRNLGLNLNWEGLGLPPEHRPSGSGLTNRPTYIKGPTDDAIDPVMIRAFYYVKDLMGQTGRIRIVDANVNGFICLDDFQFVNTQVNEQRRPPLWGFVDMHTHPMSHLGFGRKIMHGQPDNPSDQANIAAALGNCNASHGGWGIDNTGGNYIRMSILKMMDKKNPHNNGELDHNHNGFPLYPNHASIAHQQMWHEWIERAYQGGLRVMVALAVNNYLLAEAVDGDEGYKKDKESADRQLEFMVEFVKRHPFMQIARSASEMRSIVSQGKLAVILGIELDNFGDFNDPTKIVDESTVRAEIQRLFNEKGVRYIFPIHFADTKFGGCAIYSPSNLTNLASHFTRSFVSIAASPPEVIANIPGLKYAVESAPDSRIKYRLTNPLGIDISTVANASIAGLRGLIELIEGQPNPCAGGFLDPPRAVICATAGINMACPNLQCVLAQESEYRIVKNFMLTPSPEYEVYALTPGGHRNAKGITNLGIFAIKEMMRLGMMIDIDHMSEKTIESVLDIATSNNYPINSGHTGFRGNGGDSENTRTDQQLEIIRNTGGMMGVGIANNISPSFLHGYRYGMSRLNGITIGSDINGMEVMPKPRFAVNGSLIQNDDQNYNPYSLDIRNRANNKVRYTTTSEGSNVPLTMSRTAGKVWNYNFDGMAHIGLYPDYFQDLKNIGMTSIERGRLFLGAEYFAQMWEKCERQRTQIR